MLTLAGVKGKGLQETSSNPPEPSPTSSGPNWLKQVSSLSFPLVSAQLVSKMLNFFAFFLLSRSLVLKVFGNWVWAFSLIALLASCWSFGLQVWLSKASARAQGHWTHLGDILRKAFSLRLLALLVVGLGGGIWWLTVGPPDNLKADPGLLELTLAGLFIGFIFRTTSELFGATLRGHLITWPDGAALFTARLVFVVLLFWGDSHTGLSLTRVALFFAISEACAGMLNLIVFGSHFKSLKAKPNQEPPPQKYIWASFMKELSLYGGMLLASAFLFRVGMLYSGQSLSADQMGIFAVLHRLNEFSLFLPEALAAVLLPFWTRHDAHQSSPQVLRMAIIMMFTGGLMGAAAWVVGPWVLPHLFPNEAQNVAPWLWVLMPLFALQFSNQTLLAHMMAQNQEKRALVLLVLCGLVALGGMMLFAHHSLLHMIWVILGAEALFTMGGLMPQTEPHVSN